MSTINNRLPLILFILFCGLYWFLRLYHFSNLMTYHLDQGIHLLDVNEMVETRHPSLLGPMVTSKSFAGRNFFIGAPYYYVLAVYALLTHWDPLKITLLSAFVDFVFILIFTFWLRRRYGSLPALFLFLLLSFNQYFIIHTRFFWNPHFLLPLGLMAVICLDNFVKNSPRRLLWFFSFSFLWGLALSFHYTAVLWALPLLIVLILSKEWRRLLLYPLAIFAFILGDALYFVFELRHQFYNFKTIFYIFTQDLGGNSRLEPHYLVYPFVPFILWLLAFFMSRLRSHPRLLYPFLSLLFIINASFFVIITDYLPLGHPHGWTYPIALTSRDYILSSGCPQNYNIASTLSGDTRSYDIRFLLTAAGCPPQPVDSYPHNQTLYLIAPHNRPPEIETVWEVSSLRPFSIVQKIPLSATFDLYQLNRRNEK